MLVKPVDRLRRRRSGRRILPVAGLVLACLLVAACRPPIAAENPDIADGGSGAPAASPTPAPAVALRPEARTSVSARLFRSFNAADAGLQYAQALDSYAESNLVIDIAPPIVGYDPFAVEPAPDSVTVWVGSAADVAPAAAAGLDLRAVGEITGRDATVLALPSDRQGEPLSALAGQTVLADTETSAAAVRAALAGAGVDPQKVTILTPDDPSAPFDPTPLFDGTATAAAVSLYDGWARIVESLAAQGADPASWTQASVWPEGGEPLGELVWARAEDIADPALRPAITAFLGVVAQSQIACSQNVEDCAGAASAQSDRTPEGIAWSIDQLDRLLFPAPDGIAHIDPAAWDRTLAAASAAGVDGAAGLTFTNDLVDAVLAALGPSLDVHGADFVPRDDLPLVPPTEGADGGAGTTPEESAPVDAASDAAPADGGASPSTAP